MLHNQHHHPPTTSKEATTRWKRFNDKLKNLELLLYYMSNTISVAIVNFVQMKKVLTTILSILKIKAKILLELLIIQI